MCFTALFDGLGAGWRWMRWKVVKIFQEIELRAWRDLTETRLVSSQRQDFSSCQDICCALGESGR